jgi:hypothetical protein
MRIRLRRTDRRPPWPWWAAAAVAVWVLVGCAAMHVARLESQPIDLCMFKRVTGLPCPTCGVTRSAWRLAHGDILAAIRNQPFMSVAGLLFALITVLRVGFARRIDCEMSPATRRVVLGLVAVAFLVNWWYVIVFVG